MQGRPSDACSCCLCQHSWADMSHCPSGLHAGSPMRLLIALRLACRRWLALQSLTTVTRLSSARLQNIGLEVSEVP